MMKIKSGNIVIRSAEIKDAKILTDWWNDGKVMAHAGFPNGLNTTEEDTTKLILNNRTKLSQLCIIEIDDLKVGELNYRIMPNVAEIGIKICDSNYQSKGYGTKILKNLIHFLFTDDLINQQTEIEKITLDTNLNNTRAQNTYLKIGFKKIKVVEDAFTDQLGISQSAVIFEMTKKDYFKGEKNDLH